MEENKNMITEAQEVLENLRAEKAELAKLRAAQVAPVAEARDNKSMQLREAFDQVVGERRSITLSGTGSVAVINEIVKVAKEKDDFLAGARFFYGPNSSTVIPVLNPRPATPAYAAEGATGIASDTTAALGATTVQPFAWVSVLPVSYETLKMCGADFEAQLPGIFADAFRKGMADGMINGAGTAGTMKGVFKGVPAANQIACAAAGAPAIADLVKLAMKIREYDVEDPCIVINPTFYSAITAASVSGYDFYREEMIRNKTLEGVKLLVTGKAPTTTTAGSVVAVATSLKNYAVGVSAELSIDPIKVKGDTNTYFQAVMCFNGKPICEGSNWGLKTV